MSDATMTLAPAKSQLTSEERKVLVAASLGTVFEWYDFVLFGSLAGLIGQQRFMRGAMDIPPQRRRERRQPFFDLLQLSLTQFQMLMDKQFSLRLRDGQYRQHSSDGSKRHIHIAHVPDHARLWKLVNAIVTVARLRVDLDWF